MNFKFNKRIGFGVGYGGSQERYIEYDNNNLEKILYAINLGYNIIDTAQGYGIDYSGEKLIGKIKKNLSLFKITKISPENFSYDNFIKSVQISYKNFGNSKINLLLLHWPSYDVPIE